MTSTRQARGLEPFSLVTWLIAGAIASGCGGNGCSCVEPIPGGFPEDERVPNAIQVRVSDQGFGKIEADPAGLIAGLIGNGSGLTFEVPSSCGSDPEVCCNGTSPISPCGPIELDLTPQAANEQPGQSQARLVIDPVSGAQRIDVTMRARVRTLNDLQVHTLGTTCMVEVNTRDAGNPSLTLTLQAQFSQEAWGTTRVDINNVAITNFDNGDLSLKPGDLTCYLFDAFKGVVIPNFVSTFEDSIKGMLEDQLCKACPSGDVAECGPHATACTDNVCEVADGVCEQELGITGRMRGDAVLGSFSPGTLGAMDVYDVAGGYATTQSQGAALGLYGGMLPAGADRDRCGPPATPPDPVTIPQSSYFQGNTRPDTGDPFDIAIGVHKSNLDQLAYSAYQGGLMCLNIGTRTVDLLTSETLAILMPSFIDLVHGTVAQMVLGLRPQSPPTIVLGEGTTDADGNILDPLLDVNFTGLEIDFYGMVDDQWIRLMTLVADVHLPINLDVDDQGQLVPVLGDLDNAFSNLSVKNSDPLVETPQELADKFPAVLDLALPLVANGLGGFALPAIGGLQLVIPPGGITAVDNKEFLAIFADFEITSAAPVHTTATLSAARVPGRAVYAADHLDQQQRPQVDLDLGGTAADGGSAVLEWSVRVDGGLWSPYSRNPHRSLSRPAFWLPGEHRIEVRAREVGKPWTTDRTPVVLRPMLWPADAPHATDTTVIAFHGQSSGSGCNCDGGLDRRSAGGAGLLALLALLGLAGGWRRRLRRAAPLLLVLVAGALAPAGCSCGGSEQCSGEGGACADGEVERGPLGRWDSIAVDGNRAVVSAYEESLGDLVLVDVTSEPWTYTAVDGVPDATPYYKPSTYRGGVLEAGPDVGAWTSVTLRDGMARIAYQDIDAGVLRFATEFGDGWTSHVVDSDTQGGRVGLYTSLAWSPAGTPAIAYMASGLDDGSGGKKAQLRLAVASTANPGAESEWTVSVLAETAISCAGLCGDGKVCLPATDTEGERCASPSTDCTADCADGEACMAGACTAIVVDPPAYDLPRGTGLFAHLGYLPDGRAVVVYYDREAGDLLMSVNSTSWSVVPLDADAGTDTGMSAAMAIDGGGVVHVAYQDALGDQLLYVSWAADQVRPVEVVDDGTRSGDRTHPVGAGAAVAIVDGQPVIAYQDGATSDLLLARRGGSGWTRSDLLVGPMLDGFYNSAAVGGRALVSSYRYDRAYYPPGELVVTPIP